MKWISLFIAALFGQSLMAQHEHHHQNSEGIPILGDVDAQPLVAHAVRIGEALDFVGSGLPLEIKKTLEQLKAETYNASTVTQVQELLDPFCLAYVDINPESRVKVLPGPAIPRMIQHGWVTYLVKVHNQANITARLNAESPNAAPILHVSTSAHRMHPENEITGGELSNRFVELLIYEGRPLSAHLSGLEVEYFLLQLYTKETGKRALELGFNVGQGSQDIGFRNTIDLLFNIEKSVKVLFEVWDENKEATMASFIITDGIDRFADLDGMDYRARKARSMHWMEGKGKPKIELTRPNQLLGIYPLPARRLALKDEYPDFFFQPQIYRTTGEYVYLPPGQYHVQYGRGPEYLDGHKIIEVPDHVDSFTISFNLERWIHMAEMGWYSADHHIHAAGCSHYESPTEGVRPEDMWRQVLGEDLNMGNNLTWGPSWYAQKKYFTAKNHELSDQSNILRYDVEVSGFPSSHAGHIVLLNLKEDDYPGTQVIEEWPSWTLPVLTWAKSQGGITGYAHSGWGLEPIESTRDLPNHIMPKMDGIGANEYIVTVTHDVIDFYSAGDTPWPAELNMWYHTLNAGFRVPISGETDFPCISDEKVGRARIYAKLDDGLEFNDYMEALLQGKSYVSTGHAHLIDFKVNDLELGEASSTLRLEGKEQLHIQIKASAYLEPSQDEIGRNISQLSPYQSPYWHIERSRKGSSREIDIELIENGKPIGAQQIEADGKWNEISFTQTPSESSWYAIRIHGSAHTNPIFVELDDKPIRVKQSIDWCRQAVDKCWEQKQGRIRDAEKSDAKAAYDHARSVYDQLLEP